MESFIGTIRGERQKVISVPQKAGGETGDYVVVMPLELAIEIVNDLEHLVRDKRFAEEDLLKDSKARLAIWKKIDSVKSNKE